jgi:hypothetical protein
MEMNGQLHVPVALLPGTKDFNHKTIIPTELSQKKPYQINTVA